MIALMRRILNECGVYKKRVQIAFIFSFLKSMMAKVPPFLAFYMVLQYMKHSFNTQTCVILGVGIGVSLALQVIFQNISDRLQSAAGFMIFADKRNALGEHLRNMPMGYFTEGNIGKISSVLSSDMIFIEENCMTVLADMMDYIFSEIIMVLFLFYLNIWLGVIGLILIGVFLIVGNGLEKEALENSANRQNQNEKLTNAVIDFAEGIGIIKTYNMLGKKSKDLSNNFEKQCEVSLNFEAAHLPWQRASNIVYDLSSAILLAVSIYLFKVNAMTSTYVIAMILFTFDIFVPIKTLYGNSARLTVMNSCLDRMENVFQQPELKNNGTKHIKENQSSIVSFQNVSFGYGEKEVLHDVSFKMKKNTMTALVGPSGGGKSTIASLLTRFWDVKRGEVKIYGNNIKDVPLGELMDQISMVFQKVYLFHDTIYNNIIMGRLDASKEEVILAAKKARCYDFIMKLPNGFETVVGEGGASLSGGECQRISIARCILKDSPIVILDEATASVDADNECYIQEAISELCKGKTLLIIAHKLNTIKEANQILVVSGGEIKQKGTHEELMAVEGIYKNFVTVRQNSKGWSSR